MTPSVYIIGKMDAKGVKLAYVAACVRRAGAHPVLVDVGTGNVPQSLPDIASSEVAAFHPAGWLDSLEREDRGKAVSAMSEALEPFLVQAVDRGLAEGVFALCHGGPIAMACDAAHVMGRTKGVHGFYGASSMERLPTEKAIAEQIRAFPENRFS